MACSALSRQFCLLPSDAPQSAVLPRQVVCPSVTLISLRYRDHIGWNSSKRISCLVSLECLLFADSNIVDLLQGEHIRERDGVGKSGFRLSACKSSNISEALQDGKKVLLGSKIRAFDWCRINDIG